MIIFDLIFLELGFVNEPKLATYEVCESVTDGEGTAPTRMEAVGKWNNNAQINKITLGTATFDSTTTMKSP